MATIDNARTSEFLKLYSQCQRQVYVYVRARCRSSSDADDIVQQVATVLWSKFDEYRREQDFTRWALGIARLESLKQRRAARLFPGQLGAATNFNEELAELVEDEVVAASESAGIRSDALGECLGKVAPLGQLMLRQRYTSNKSVAEIAQAMQRSESAVYKTLQKIHELLYECVERKIERRASP